MRLLHTGSWLFVGLLVACSGGGSGSKGSTSSGSSGSGGSSGGGSGGGSSGASSGSSSGGGACNDPDSLGGTVTATFQGTAYPCSCWANSAGSAGLAGAQVTVGCVGSDFNLEIAFASPDGGACAFSQGQTVNLSDACLGITAGITSVKVDMYGGSDTALLQASTPNAPTPTGSLTITDWTPQSGGTIGFTLSSDAALPNLPSAPGGTSVLVPVKGSGRGIAL